VLQLLGNGVHAGESDAGSLFHGQRVVGGFELHRRTNTDGPAVHASPQQEQRNPRSDDMLASIETGQIRYLELPAEDHR
jgi:hypothetical protein